MNIIQIQAENRQRKISSIVKALRDTAEKGNKLNEEALTIEAQRMFNCTRRHARELIAIAMISITEEESIKLGLSVAEPTQTYLE